MRSVDLPRATIAKKRRDGSTEVSRRHSRPVDRAEGLKGLFRCSLQRTIDALTPLLRGWSNYFRHVEVKGTFEELDGWVRRRLGWIIWRQWKRTCTRAGNLMKRGLTEERAWRSATNGQGPWWNAGASHINHATPKGTMPPMLMWMPPERGISGR